MPPHHAPHSTVTPSNQKHSLSIFSPLPPLNASHTHQSMDFYLQPLTFRAPHGSNDEVENAANASNATFASLFQSQTYRISQKILIEHRNEILWVWDFERVTKEGNFSGRNWQVKGGGVLGSSVVNLDEETVQSGDMSQMATQRDSRSVSPRKKRLTKGSSNVSRATTIPSEAAITSATANLHHTHKKSYLHVQEERLRRCRVGSSLVKRLEKPIFEREMPHAFDLVDRDESSGYQSGSRWRNADRGGIFHMLNTMDSSSDVISRGMAGGFQHEEVEEEYSFERENKATHLSVRSQNSTARSVSSLKAGSVFKGLVDAKSAFLKKKKSSIPSVPTPDMDAFTMMMLGQDLTNSQNGKLSRHMTANGGAKKSTLHSKQLSEEERKFISQFGTLTLAKDCPILENTKIAQEMPLIPTVHVELHSWGDIVRISRLQKQKDWEKYLLDRERDRDCVLGQSNELADVCSRAMKAAADWRSDRIMGNTLKDLQKKKSLWQGPATRYRKKLDSHTRRKTFFQSMVEKSMSERDNAPRIISLQTRKEESRRKVLWALYLLRVYMLEEWNVDEKLFFHFCEMYGYTTHMDYKMLLFFKNFENAVGLTPAQVREYKQAQDEGRLSVLRFLANRYQITEKSLNEFAPKREKARQEFIDQHGDDLFITNAGGTGKLRRIDSTYSLDDF